MLLLLLLLSAVLQDVDQRRHLLRTAQMASGSSHIQHTLTLLLLMPLFCKTLTSAVTCCASGLPPAQKP
jgi:hypothetical protein